ncbi:copper-transporting P-type ATPase [Flavisolibacter nicotianae]|uniref:copper-transporting P-type ATPase n=1 Tax=Flavisolibacter nicotianae TaxID=2364882 RepID=UPI000EB058F7|nr:copper-translocating P-type ATPase [Flavisolibacter nicotianae]
MHEHKTSTQKPVDASGIKYACPMHCEGDKTYDSPGKCPVCGMNLVPVQEVGNKKNENKQHDKHQTANGNTGKYYCPMHCEGDKTYNKPGDCPVCGMRLVKEPTASSHATAKTQYTCPMHPQIIRDVPGSCPICGMDLVPMQPVEEDEDKAYKELLKKFKIAVLFTLPILLIAMSDMLPNNPLHSLFGQPVWNWIQFALSLPVVFYATWMFFKRAWTSIVTWNLNMFTLIGIGTGVAFLFSVIAMLFPHIFPAQFKTESGTVFVYFEATTVILTLILLGQLLEARAHSRTSGAIKALLKLVPSEATLISNGEEKVIPIDQIKSGDHLRIKPGEKIPVDGKLVQGEASIDEAMITGEPVPVDKRVNDKVTSGTINTTSSFVMEAEIVGAETLLSQIIQLVNDASRSRAPIQKLADKISKYFVPIVVIVSVLTFFAWVLFGPEPRYVYAFVNAIAVLIIACPCALGLATPMSVMVGVGRGAQSGVLIKNAEALEKMNKVDTLIIDKTGTITEGKPSLEKVIATEGYNEDGLLQQISSLNKQSEHPLATAVVKYANEKKVKLSDVKDFNTVAGKGVVGTVDDKKIALGNAKLMEEIKTTIPESLLTQVHEEQVLGKTVSFISVDGKAAGYITITDKIKETSKAAIAELLENNIEVIMLTGDNANTAKTVANELNLSGYKAEFLPQDKLNEVKWLQTEGKKVAVAGDGINDAPALAQADVGIGMGTGTDVAIESAAITLVKGDLQGIAKAEKLSKAVMRNIKQNLFFAFIYNVIGVPVAAGILFPFFGILLSPMIAAAAMSVSSVSVIANSLRLRSVKL